MRKQLSIKINKIHKHIVSEDSKENNILKSYLVNISNSTNREVLSQLKNDLRKLNVYGEAQMLANRLGEVISIKMGLLRND
jgi:hypothetical protein